MSKCDRCSKELEGKRIEVIKDIYLGDMDFVPQGNKGTIIFQDRGGIGIKFDPDFYETPYSPIYVSLSGLENWIKIY